MTATYTSRDLAAAAQVNPSVACSHWAPRFGIVGRGSGSRNRYTLGHMVIARALRSWLGPGDQEANANVVRRFCQQGPALVDDQLPRPRYLVLLDDHVLPVDDPAAIVAASALGGLCLHIIDVEAALRDLAVTPPE